MVADVLVLTAKQRAGKQSVYMFLICVAGIQSLFVQHANEFRAACHVACSFHPRKKLLAQFVLPIGNPSMQSIWLSSFSHLACCLCVIAGWHQQGPCDELLWSEGD